MTKRDAAATRAIHDRDLWDSCQHALSEPDHHSCPQCNGTLRRCCDSIVGHRPHRPGCPEVARRTAAVS